MSATNIYFIKSEFNKFLVFACKKIPFRRRTNAAPKNIKKYIPDKLCILVLNSHSCPKAYGSLQKDRIFGKSFIKIV